jgi:hypothetical protein
MSGEPEGYPEIRRHPLEPNFDGQTEASDDSVAASEMFVGFVGDSPSPSFVRVYASLSLGSYCEIKKSDIVSASPLDASDALSPTLMRVKAEARVEYVRTDRIGGDASYVAGRIMSKYGARSVDRPTTSEPDDTYLMVHPPITPVVYCTSQVYPPC